jgi:RNA polymerase sigma-70 factor (sigma-E family)
MTFEEFVAEQGGALLRLAYVLTGDPHQAEDLVQSSLTQVFTKWSTVKQADSPVAYTRRILVNQHLSWKRRRWTSEAPAEVEEPEQPVDDTADVIVSRDALRSLLARLSPRARTILVLRYYVDLADADIAVALGISPGSVRAIASRSLLTIRRSVTADIVQETR